MSAWFMKQYLAMYVYAVLYYEFDTINNNYNIPTQNSLNSHSYVIRFAKNCYIASYAPNGKE